MITIKLDLTDDMLRELDARMRDASHASVEDYVRDLIAADLEPDADWLTPEVQAAIDEGEASGFEPYDFQSVMAEARSKFRGE